jgi:hypothetical protein
MNPLESGTLAGLLGLATLAIILLIAITLIQM